MRWKDMRRSDNVEDRRGMPMAGAGLKLGGGGLLLIVVLSLLTGTNPLDILSGLEESAPRRSTADPSASPRWTMRRLTSSGPSSGTPRTPGPDSSNRAAGPTSRRGSSCSAGPSSPRAVRRARRSGRSTVPPDRRVYLDLGFFRELSERFGAPGDFARAYVIAHEIGHHVQNLTGISERVQRQRARMDQAGANALSVRLELQADCYAGVWGYSAARRNILEPGTSRRLWPRPRPSATIAYRSRRAATSCPESFTHGSSAQRVQWFRTGLESGDVRRCDTFTARS